MSSVFFPLALVGGEFYLATFDLFEIESRGLTAILKQEKNAEALHLFSPTIQISQNEVSS